MYWPISMPRIPIAALLTALITYLYGQATFCENVLRAIGETPSIFVRISWAISPVILMVSLTSDNFNSYTHFRWVISIHISWEKNLSALNSRSRYYNVYIRLQGFFCAGMGSWPHKDKVAGWVLTVTILLPITGVMLCYLLFRCRVRVRMHVSVLCSTHNCF